MALLRKSSPSKTQKVSPKRYNCCQGDQRMVKERHGLLYPLLSLHSGREGGRAQADSHFLSTSSCVEASPTKMSTHFLSMVFSPSEVLLLSLCLDSIQLVKNLFKDGESEPQAAIPREQVRPSARSEASQQVGRTTWAAVPLVQLVSGFWRPWSRWKGLAGQCPMLGGHHRQPPPCQHTDEVKVV